MRKNTEIDEIIADAIAEEEVAKEQERTAKDLIRDNLKDTITSNHDEAKVTISLSEYIVLKQKEADLDRILNAIVHGLGLNYSKDDLRLGESDNLVSAIRVLYPDMYDTLLTAELENVEG